MASTSVERKGLILENSNHYCGPFATEEDAQAFMEHCQNIDKKLLLWPIERGHCKLCSSAQARTHDVMVMPYGVVDLLKNDPLYHGVRIAFFCEFIP